MVQREWDGKSSLQRDRPPDRIIIAVRDIVVPKNLIIRMFTVESLSHGYRMYDSISTLTCSGCSPAIFAILREAGRQQFILWCL